MAQNLRLFVPFLAFWTSVSHFLSTHYIWDQNHLLNENTAPPSIRAATNQISPGPFLSNTSVSYGRVVAPTLFATTTNISRFFIFSSSMAKTSVIAMSISYNHESRIDEFIMSIHIMPNFLCKSTVVSLSSSTLSTIYLAGLNLCLKIGSIINAQELRLFIPF